MAPPHESSPYRLLVEGPDDQWSVINLLRRHGYDWDDASRTRPYVKPTGGIEKLLRPAALLSAVKSLDRLALVMDADTAPTKRWREVMTMLRPELQIPSQPDPNGTVVVRSNLPGTGVSRLGIWMMPDNDAAGALEHFLARLVPSGDPTWAHANTSTHRARELGSPLKEKDLAKGTIHAWLAWQEEPGQPFGQALTARVLNSESPDAKRFVDWFFRVFD